MSELISAISSGTFLPTQNISAKVIFIDAQSLGLHKEVNLNGLRAVQKTFNVN